MRRRFLRRRVMPGLGLTLGCTILYLALFTLLPLMALALQASHLTWQQFVFGVTSPRALAAYRVTVACAAWATAFNAVFGLLLAWILVRYRFPGRGLIDALVDLPFALPTAVAGIALTALFVPTGWLGRVFALLDIQIAYAWPGIAIAMAFTSVPFVVRSVQPVLQDLAPDIEEAARSLGARDIQVFRRVVFPEIFPAFLAGCSLAFARALGEFGAVIFIAGNLPQKTEIVTLLAVVRLEEFDYEAAAALAVVMLAVSFLMLVVTNLIQGWHIARAGTAP